MTFYETSLPLLHASKLVSHILQDYLRLSRFRALINQKPLSPSLNLKLMSISSSTRETRTVDHLACSLPHLGIPWLPIPLLILLSLENSDNANNLHLLLWMIAPPRCTSLLSSCVCDLLQNMGNHKSPYPLAGAIR